MSGEMIWSLTTTNLTLTKDHLDLKLNLYPNQNLLSLLMACQAMLR